jgi:hypothetical protein
MGTVLEVSKGILPRFRVLRTILHLVEGFMQFFKCCCLFPLNSFSFLSEDLTLSNAKLRFCWKHRTSIQLLKNDISLEMPCFVKNKTLWIFLKGMPCVLATVQLCEAICFLTWILYTPFGTHFCPGVGLFESEATICEPFVFPLFSLNRLVQELLYIIILQWTLHFDRNIALSVS